MEKGQADIPGVPDIDTGELAWAFQHCGPWGLDGNGKDRFTSLGKLLTTLVTCRIIEWEISMRILNIILVINVSISYSTDSH